MPYTALHHTLFLLNGFSIIYTRISLSNFAFFTVKSPNVTQRSVSQENALRRAKTRRLFFPHKTIGSNNYFTPALSSWNQFQVFKKAKFGFKVTVQGIAFGQNAPSCDPLNFYVCWDVSQHISTNTNATRTRHILSCTPDTIMIFTQHFIYFTKYLVTTKSYAN